MHRASETNSAQDRGIGLHLNDRSLAPRVLEALRQLGYDLRSADEDDFLESARVRLVDIERINELPTEKEAPDLRLLAIGLDAREEFQDSRIFAQTHRPGRLGSVYAMIQKALEKTPRKCPRIPTRLSARCIRSDRRSIGAVLSLSEGGCLLRTSELLRRGSKINLQFALPEYGLISTPAECRYTRQGDVGLTFSEPPPDVRRTIAHFITLELASQSQLTSNERAYSA